MNWIPVFALVAALTIAGCSGSSSKAAPNTSPTISPTIPLVTTIPVAKPPIDPCTLLTAQDATKLTGLTMKPTPVAGTAGSLACTYSAGPSGGAEITVKVDVDARTAHDEFGGWVQPIPGRAVGLTTSSVPNLGNEASATRNMNVNDGIYVRRNAVLVKIGAYPAVGDAALLTAARTALARLRAAG